MFDELKNIWLSTDEGKRTLKISAIIVAVAFVLSFIVSLFN